MNIVILSGRSGAGKSICLRVLEDLGYFCIDNLPAELLPFLADKMPTRKNNLAVSIDGRSSEQQLKKFSSVIEHLRAQGVTCQIVFLDADEQTLLKRYQETRRKHPLTDKETSLLEAFKKERDILEPISLLVDMPIDTTHLSMQQLRKLLFDRLRPEEHTTNLSLLVFSFGFKFGAPSDVDYVFDVRCLPNPYWEPELSTLDGRDDKVITFLKNQPLSQEMISDIEQFLLKWIPHYETVNRHYVNIGIGCTGGQHRSVYIAETLGKQLKVLNYDVQVRHREL